MTPPFCHFGAYGVTNRRGLPIGRAIFAPTKRKEAACLILERTDTYATSNLAAIVGDAMAWGARVGGFGWGRPKGAKGGFSRPALPSRHAKAGRALQARPPEFLQDGLRFGTPEGRQGRACAPGLLSGTRQGWPGPAGPAARVFAGWPQVWDARRAPSERRRERPLLRGKRDWILTGFGRYGLFSRVRFPCCSLFSSSLSRLFRVVVSLMYMGL